MITSFSGENRFLSNFVPARVVFEGHEYPTVEHAYVAAKTTCESLRKQVRLCPTPGQAKRLGRTFELRPDWEEVKVGIMENLLRQKFSRQPYRQLLLETGSEQLVEGNTWGDRFWGVCRGQGLNMLGTLLMKIRRDLSNQWK